MVERFTPTPTTEVTTNDNLITPQRQAQINDARERYLAIMNCIHGYDRSGHLPPLLMLFQEQPTTSEPAPTQSQYSLETGLKRLGQVALAVAGHATLAILERISPSPYKRAVDRMTAFSLTSKRDLFQGTRI